MQNSQLHDCTYSGTSKKNDECIFVHKSCISTTGEFTIKLSLIHVLHYKCPLLIRGSTYYTISCPSVETNPVIPVSKLCTCTCPPHTHSPRQHSVQQHPKAPDIDGRVVPLFLQHLWGHKVSCVTRRHQKTVLRSQLLGKTKVSYAQGIVRARFLGIEDVGGLQVAMDDPLLVEVLDGGCLQGKK